MSFRRPRPGPIVAGAAVLAATVTTALSGCGGDSEQAGPIPGDAPVTSTTKVAGANVLGNLRRPDESCAPEPAPVDEGPERREVRHAAGTTDVAADPQRIVVLSGDQLDALCALGLQSRVVAAALADGAQTQPSYLGRVIHDVPAAGTRTDPDLDAVRAAKPDLILGSEALSARDFGPLSGIAPTVFSGPPGAGWQDTLRTVAEATGRAGAGTRLLEGFESDAKDTGVQNDATHYQASVVRLGEDTMRIYGVDDFAGSVLRSVGVERPPGQRFTDKPYLEVGTADLGGADFSAAEGDIVYVSFDSPAARDGAARVLDSDAWRRLSATRDNRVFVVNDEVWQSGEGIVAARGILDDLRLLNAPIN
ncbi:iron-siderophore ABC transporter substrate-binding protein [Mycolicibacterium sediminis]|uniref:Fe3+-citrate ABC transporter substrate-binding protein n=1 Tax=Mycolicibacterium sediminis TaxID=1286180 RepID=A0A7I7QS35_9MYCO|nr:iron-siderophore ABC transporter substrate-binding protein [Mycolicibacterium sediminis]BBY29161.1 Fe3+-citrate ABC transporter substrate-binding protein [Mycolicibacterium sediminis]